MSIYENLRKDILNGAFDPGEKLKLESQKHIGAYLSRSQQPE